MQHLKTLTVAAALLGGSALASQAQELHFIMCGGEVRPADQKVIDKFQADNPGVTVKMEAVEWGTCQDKSMQLAAAGDPPDVAYMGSRTLRQLANNDLIIPVTFTPEEEAVYQPGVLKTVTNGGQYWGIPHAFSTKALYMNCAVIEAAGAECKAPETWADLVALAKQVTDNTDAAGIVYYANWLRFLERGRTELLRLLGQQHTALREERGVNWVVRRCAIDYLKPARLDDTIEIVTRCGELRGASLDMVQQARRNEEILVQAELVVACMGEGGRPVRLPPLVRTALAPVAPSGSPRSRHIRIQPS